MERLLYAAFELFRKELIQEDAKYAASLNLQTESLEAFCAAYFKVRCEADPFDWAKHNLQESSANAKCEITVKWRYAILRIHEVFGVLASHLIDSDFSRFNEALKPVFVDNYATVPHDFIRRLLALHAAKKLKVVQLDDESRLDIWSSERGAAFIMRNSRLHFPAFVEATGQKVASAKEFPFPSLLRQRVIQDVEVRGEDAPKRGIALDGAYHPGSALHSSERLFCLSLPFLLGQHPFAQGITSSADMAAVVAASLQKAEMQRTWSSASAENHAACNMREAKST